MNSNPGMSDLEQLAQELEANRLRQHRAATLALLSAQLPPQPQPQSPASSSVLPGPTTGLSSLSAQGNLDFSAAALQSHLQALEAADRIRLLREQLSSAVALEQLLQRQHFAGPSAIASLPVSPYDTLTAAPGIAVASGTFGSAPIQDNPAAATAATVPEASSPKKRRGGISDPFPCKLHRVLSEVERDGHADIVSWLPHGRAFAIHEPERFVSEVMPKYFRMSSLSSLQRQLNLYNFKRITEGRDKGAYYHRLFLRGQPELTKDLKRTKTKRVFVHTTDANGVPMVVPRGLATLYEPNFYTMPPLQETDVRIRQQHRPTDCNASLAASHHPGRH